MVLEKLYENKKIASATHNIYAYRSVMSDIYDLTSVMNLLCKSCPHPLVSVTECVISGEDK